jgi:hypothetical protein
MLRGLVGSTVLGLNMNDGIPYRAVLCLTPEHQQPAERPELPDRRRLLEEERDRLVERRARILLGMNHRLTDRAGTAY